MQEVPAAVFGWRHAVAVALKDATEIVGVQKPGCLGNFGHGHALLQQQALGALNAILIQIADWRRSHLLCKTLVHVRDRQMDQVCQHALGDGFGVVLVDIVAEAKDALADVLHAVAPPAQGGGMEGEQLAKHAEHAVALVLLPVKGERQRLAQEGNRFVNIRAGKNTGGGWDAGFGEVGRDSGTGKLDPVLLKKVAVGVNGVALNGIGGKEEGAGSGKRHAADEAVPAEDKVEHPDRAGHSAGVIANGRVAPADFQDAERRLADGLGEKDFCGVFPDVRNDHL